LKRLRGVIPADLLVFYVSREIARRAEEKVASVVNNNLMAAIRGLKHSQFELLLGNIAKGSDILTRVGAIEGIREV
jgi:hypothetical protein